MGVAMAASRACNRYNAPAPAPAPPNSFIGFSCGAATLKLVLATVLTLALCIPPAHSQSGGPGELSRIADELQDIKLIVESINTSSTLAFLGSFLGSMAIAIIAVWATIKYARKLEENTGQIEHQVTQSEEHLELARRDARNRLRPTLVWGMPDSGPAIRITDWRERPSGLTIRLLNAGQVSARDIIMYVDARVVGDDGKPGVPGHRLRRLGALGPGRHIDIFIPVSVEALGRVLSGGLAYIEARFSYMSGGRQTFQYHVGGYVSNAIITLFDVVGQEQITALMPHVGAPGARGREPRGGTAVKDGSAVAQEAEGAGPGAPLPDLEQCERDIAASPKSATAHRAMGTALHRMGRHVEALEVLKTAMDLDPVDGRTIKEMARVLGSLGRYEDAIGQLMRIVDRDHNDVCVERELVRLYTMLGQHQQAHSALSRLDKLDPCFETRMRMAATSVVMRHHDAAVYEFRSAIEMRPDETRAHFGMGVAQMNSRHSEEALVTLRRVIEMDPGMADAHVCLAHTLYRLGLEEEACEAFDRAVEACPKSQRAHVNRGIIMLELGRFSEARESFAAARRLDPSLQVPQVRASGGADPGPPGSAGDDA